MIFLSGKRLVTVCFMLFIIAFMAPACSREKEPAQKPQNGSVKPEEPEALQKILAENETLITELGKNMDIQVQGEKQQQQAQSSGGEEQSQDKEGKQHEEEKGQDSKSSVMQESGIEWTKAEESIKKIHREWNDVEPEAVKAGLSNTVRDEFEKTLEELTMSIEKKDKENGLINAIEIYDRYANLSQVFSTSVPPAYFRFKYMVMLSSTYGIMGDWEQARKNLPSLQEHWMTLKTTAEEQDAMLLAQIEYALTDLTRAIDMEARELVVIKNEIIMTNMEKLKEEMKKTSMK